MTALPSASDPTLNSTGVADRVRSGASTAPAPGPAGLRAQSQAGLTLNRMVVGRLLMARVRASQIVERGVFNEAMRQLRDGRP